MFLFNSCINPILIQIGKLFLSKKNSYYLFKSFSRIIFNIGNEINMAARKQ